MSTRPSPADLRLRLSELPPAGLLRRFGAMVYDGLLVIALMLTTTGLLNLFAARPVIPEGAETVSIEAMETVSGPLLSTILFIQTFVFFAYFWVHHGRTLGMQAWRLRIIAADGGRSGPCRLSDAIWPRCRPCCCWARDTSGSCWIRPGSAGRTGSPGPHRGREPTARSPSASRPDARGAGTRSRCGARAPGPSAT
ncbi:MAG: RDD family protein [Gammaproteobacteria bacterium]|nr:RDD family protein [Gammaproteobacteria bacterium]